MSDFNLGHLISKFVNYQALNINRAAQNTAAQQQTQFNNNVAQTAAQTASQVAKTTAAEAQMANLGGSDRSVYIKDLMKLPRNLNELIFILQQNISNAQLQQRFNQQLAAHRNLLSQTQAQILAQLQGLTLPGSVSAQTNQALLNQLSSSLKNLPIMANGMINLSDISALIQANGKDAVTKLIMAMAGAAKQGVSDLSQLKDTAKLINASIALASQGDNTQTLKTLLLLYLPWLPLQEGVGFDLDIETAEGSEADESILTITISTINYGIVTAVLILESKNSVHINIECAQKFPKEELLLRIEGEEKHYSVQSKVNFSTVEEKKSTTDKPQAKINMSNTNEINPYLLLMAHTIIRHTIEIDKNTSIGVTSHMD